jgi:hypothetical protein
MVRSPGVGPLLATLVSLVLALATTEARATDGPVRASGTADAQADKAGTKKRHKSLHKSPAGKTGEGVSTGGKLTRATRPSRLRGKPPRVARQRSGRDLGHTINDNVQITPFPSHAAAARRALAQNRRDRIDDAERAARDPKLVDRWQTVLFNLREFDSRDDPEVCFWRVVAYFRLGEIARARGIRQSCELTARDQPIVENEDILAAGLQPATALPELAAAGERGPAPVSNPAGYEGASPTRLER